MICPQCQEREVTVKVIYANGMQVLCCNECARKETQVEEKREDIN
jgi:hypothetical protein